MNNTSNSCGGTEETTEMPEAERVGYWLSRAINSETREAELMVTIGRLKTVIINILDYSRAAQEPLPEELIKWARRELNR